jgi:hypothetical protein
MYRGDEKQTDFFPVMHRNQRYPRPGNAVRTIVIRLPCCSRAATLGEMRVLIRVFGYPTDGRATRDPVLNRSRIPPQAPISLYKTPEISRNLRPSRHSVATFVANPQQHRPKSASMAPQPYAAAIASLMVAHGLGQMDWDFQ